MNKDQLDRLEKLINQKAHHMKGEIGKARDYIRSKINKNSNEAFKNHAKKFEVKGLDFDFEYVSCPGFKVNEKHKDYDVLKELSDASKKIDILAEEAITSLVLADSTEPAIKIYQDFMKQLDLVRKEHLK